MMNNDKIQGAVSKLLEMWQSGNMPSAIARTMIKPIPGSEVPSDFWSLGNKLIMYCFTEDARGFEQWHKVGRNVKKGAKCFYILAPLAKKIKAKEVEDGEEKELEKTIIQGFKAIPVFRIEDTEGKEIVRPDYRPLDLPPLHDVALEMGLDVTYAPGRDGSWGYYVPDKEKIVLHTTQHKTFFHELSHHMHNTLLKKQGKSLCFDRNSEAYAEQEIIADMSACVLCELYGFTGYEAHVWRYIQGYAGTNSVDATLKKVMQLLNIVQDVVSSIMEIAENKKVA